MKSIKIPCMFIIDTYFYDKINKNCIFNRMLSCQYNILLAKCGYLYSKIRINVRYQPDENIYRKK